MRLLLPAVLLSLLLTGCSRPKPKRFTGTVAYTTASLVTVENPTEGNQTFLAAGKVREEAGPLLFGAPIMVEYTGTPATEDCRVLRIAVNPTYALAVGDWKRPDPLIEDGVMGIYIKVCGIAESFNMATLRYTSWQLVGENLIKLHGQSIGNGQTIDFTETARIIPGIEGAPPTLQIEGSDISYTKDL